MTVPIDSNLAAFDHFGTVWLQQMFANMERVASVPTVGALDHAFDGKVAVVVSPGPSLVRNARYLEAFVNRSVIIASTHAVSALRKLGIEPDVVMAIDPQDLTYQFEDVSTIGAMALSPVCHPALWDCGAPAYFSYSGNHLVDSWMYDGLQLSGASMPEGGGSVACHQVSLAKRMGCTTIVLVGQDCAFEDGQYYSQLTEPAMPVIVDGDRFVSADGVGHRDGGDIVQVPGNKGGMVQTSDGLANVRTWFIQFAYCNPGLRLVNATDGGARLDGWSQERLGDAKYRLGPWIHTRATIKKAGVPFVPRDAQRYLAKVERRLRQVLSACADGMMCRDDGIHALRAAESRVDDALDAGKPGRAPKGTAILCSILLQRVLPELDERRRKVTCDAEMGAHIMTKFHMVYTSTLCVLHALTGKREPDLLTVRLGRAQSIEVPTEAVTPREANG